MKRVLALDLCIRYFGKWEEKTEYFQTSSAYSKSYFNFSGSKVRAFVLQGKNQGLCKVSLDGESQCIVDCSSDTEEKICVFEKYDVKGDFVHNLVLELCPREDCSSAGVLTVIGYEADIPVHYPEKLKKEMRRELAEISQNIRSWKDPSEWKPVKRKALMPMHGVLLKDSIIRKMYDLNIENLKYNATLPWYSEGKNKCEWLPLKPNVSQEEIERPGWAGWAPGQIEGSELGGVAGVLRWEDDEELSHIATEILEKMKERQRDDGYFNYYPEEASYQLKCFPQEVPGRELPYNYYDYPGLELLTERKNADRSFWTRGMVEAIRAELPDASEIVRRMYDWFNQQEKYLPYMRYGANATNGDVGGPMVYHTSIGKPEDIITNERYYDQDYWMKAFKECQPMAMSHYPGERPHSTSLLCVQAMADMYIATGDEKYLNAVLGCWDVYTRYYRHPGGLAAIIEFDIPYPPGAYEIYKHAEETCGHTNWMWINERLMQLYPREEKYVAEIEECIYNTLINSIKPRKNVYHILLHGKKEEGTNWNSCCQISAQISVSTLPQYIYTYNEKEVFVNLYIASEYNSKFGKIMMETAFPYENNVKITIDPTQGIDSRFTLNVRVPGWAKNDMLIYVNGVPVGKGVPGSYFSLNRQWKQGDTIEYILPIQLEAIRYEGFDQVEGNLPRYTFMYGPILMAMEAKECVDDTVVPQIYKNIQNLLEILNSSENKSLHFVIPDSEFCIMPYWDAPEEGFTCVPIVTEYKY